ncbi:MAG: SUF system NifU family Fe-S cluster assembly protein [Candidatus Obscuribacterales bacterium]|nr:SUF system NifU family Fe-S cluster assembly protein [Candidatus Obscuribacterales bacterium]
MSLDDLYRETILDHYHSPRNHGTIDDATASAEGVNPLCGDELTLYLKLDGDKIADIKLQSHGCSINTASGSMMSESVLGKSVMEATEIIDIFKNMMLSKSSEADLIEQLPEDLEELEALAGVKKYPVRVKCALLPWNTLIEGLESLGHKTNGNKNEKQ